MLLIFLPISFIHIAVRVRELAGAMPLAALDFAIVLRPIINTATLQLPFLPSNIFVDGMYALAMLLSLYYALVNSDEAFFS